MKIAVVGTRGFPGVQGGVENHCEKLYTNLAQLGCEIIVFVRKPYIKPELAEYGGVSLVAVDCPRNKFLEAIIHTFSSVMKARKLHPDILHIHAIGPSLFTPFARFWGTKVVITNHGPDYRRKKWPLVAKIFLMFCERVGVKYANEVICINGNIAEDIKKKYGRDSYVIPNGVDIPSRIDTDETLTRYGLQKQKYILSVGRFVPEKGFHDLIEAFNKLQTNSQNSQVEGWKLVIVGDADHEDEYSRNLKVQAEKNYNIILTGFLKGEPLQELYTHAGLFVLPSYYEGLPIVLLEAMSYGLSCIASDIAANRNIALDNERFFTAGDVDQISERIGEFISRIRKEEERENQVKFLIENYNWDKIAKETLRIYKRVIS